MPGTMTTEQIPFPDGSLHHSILDHGFFTGRPRIVSRAAMPKGVEDVMSDRWSRHYPDRNINLHLLQNVFVTGEGLVFDQKGRLYVETITQHSQEQVDEANSRLLQAIAARDVRYHPQATLLCGKLGLSNYGHWLLEMLPMAYLARESIRLGWMVHVPLLYPWMDEVIRTSLDLIGVAPERITFGSGAPNFFEQIIYVTGLSQVGVFYSAIANHCLQEIAGLIEGTSSRPVWVSRIDPAGSHRMLVSEQRISDRLRRDGWLIIHPGTMTLREQIEICRDSTHVAGVAGAGLTNSAFMRPGGRVTCFMPVTMPDIFFQHLAHHGRLDYREVRCPMTQEGKLDLPMSGVMAELDAV